ncbi:MAG: protein kinase [Gemmatimonadales bacterium]
MTDAADRLTAALADRYRLERELGAGGMATVYLAEDLKHHRKVAIKVLRPELAAVIGAERFLSEIRTTANLQHPHILPLFDSGAADSFLFYVMPLIEGESLRDRLNREKQLPISDAVRIATEVAGALDYAHRHGVIHRDIKPENILLHDGRALVADFGIALAASKAGGSRMTETGMSLGTPTYMSPEQAMGEREITSRSDVYALGVMTYEMLIGDPPFTGSTAQAVVAKVMTEKPVSLQRQRERVPDAVEDAVLTALEKLPADRFATAAEFSAALTGGGPSPRRTSASSGSRTGEGWSRGRAIATVGVVVVTAAAAFMAGRSRGRSEIPIIPPSRLAIVTPTVGGSGASSLSRQLDITPSGDAIIFVGQANQGGNSLFLQRLDAVSPVEITGSRDVTGPTIAPDGRSIIGLTTNGTYRLPFGGGVLRTIPVPTTSGTGAFGPDGTFWFTEANASGISRLTPADSVLPLATEKTRGLRMQQVLDASTALVVHAPGGTASGPGMLLNLRSGDLTPLLDGPVTEIRSVGGELLCVLPDGSLTATPFDRSTHRLLGNPVQVATGVALTGTGIAQFAVAENGTVAYIPESPRSLVLIDRAGVARTAIAEQLNLHAPHFSPDGHRLSLDITSTDGRDVWVFSLDQHTLSRATFDHDGHDATWTPDGKFLTYLSFKSGVAGIYRTRPGSTAPAESLLASPEIAYSGTWLKDGSAIITDGSNAQENTLGDVIRIDNGGRGPIRPLVASGFLESYGVPSPDGRWLAFVSDKSGRQEVYVQSLTDDGDQVQVSQEGATEAIWAPDGRELFYRTTYRGEVQLGAATIATTPTLAVTGQRILFPISDMVGTAPHANFDISPDGRTFAMVRRSPGSRIMVIQNLSALLRRLRDGTGSTP